MNLLKRYEVAKKMMPYNTKAKALNLKPNIRFEKDKLVYEEEYYYKGEKKFRTVYYDINTKKETKKPFKMPDFSMPYNPDVSMPAMSFDKKYALYQDHYNLMLKDMKTNEVTKLTEDGTENFAYGEFGFKGAFMSYLERNKPTCAIFSKDSRYAIVNVLVTENIKTLTVTQVFNNKSDTEFFRPRDFVYKDFFPAEEDAKLLAKLLVVDLKEKKVCFVEKEPFAFDPFKGLWDSVRFDDDNKGFIFMEMDVHFQKKTLYHVSFDDLKPVELFNETTNTFFYDFSLHGRINKDFGYGITLLGDGKAIYLTAKEDLNNLYYLDLKTKEERKITADDYHVSSIVSVDKENKVIYFMASHLSFMSEPYFGALCKIGFDGNEFEVLTKEDANHSITMNEDNTYFTDTYSTIEEAPVTYLYKMAGLSRELIVKADISRLLKDGYIMPKRTKVTLDDGTVLYGMIILPYNYDENKKFPVVDYIYGGPHIINTPKSFSAWGDVEGREVFGGLEALANLGIIGVIIDGRGTPFRGKKMHDISYQNLQGVNGLKDHVPFIKKLKETYKGIDLDRVGIWGNSAGGYASTRALLLYNDFYKVAVSSAGDHDNQTYNATWSYRFQGRWNKEVYLAQDSAQLVKNFKGHLLLTHGLLDDNVHPSETFRMIQYFNKANKDVDICILPDTDHNCPANLYFIKRKTNYFVKYLLGVEPLSDFSFEK